MNKLFLNDLLYKNNISKVRINGIFYVVRDNTIRMSIWVKTFKLRYNE